MAALIGAATFALISDIAARSGSSSPASAFSSSRDSCLYSCCFLPMRARSFRQLDCVMLAVCSAFAIAVELSLSAFRATAALIGAATFALISDIAARSGSSSPARAFSSSRLSWRYSCCLPMLSLLEIALVDRRRLCGVRVGDCSVREDVRRHGGVHGDREVRIHERHRGPLRQLLAET